MSEGGLTTAGTFLTTTIVFALKLQMSERVEMASDKRVLKSISLLESIESFFTEANQASVVLNFWTSLPGLALAILVFICIILFPLAMHFAVVSPSTIDT